MHFLLALLPFVTSAAFCQNIVLTNDDGWAVAQIRAQNNALIAAGFNVILSAPAENESGTGSKTAIPTTLNQSCEFQTCPTGSPAEGSDPNNPRINYVNAFPVDAVRFGIQTLSPQFFGSAPEFVVSGPNVGTNLGTVVLNSGTVGAACEAAKEGIPSTAFSATSNSQSSFTTLTTDPTSSASEAAVIYAQLATSFTQALLASPARPILPANITLNVNLPSTTGCSSASDFQFILTRNIGNSADTDVTTCGTDHLPDEDTVVTGPGCNIAVSVISALTKTDVDATTQGAVLDRLSDFLSCLS
ncbi:hypothetical protein PHLCEN_2v2606 [Hermanssonia centrifuga]|uniref:Survival protein SurE-like phosphatase/nucleotidase domain-containing protein n=1 Tax=Hermanssonia centrifuga TaxID=98765 RepID=A0A2R6RLJ2_9APHY|nr:hypothetical protein PHLCEN_2v2606 [Hermanssonia centrifuga]